MTSIPDDDPAAMEPGYMEPGYSVFPLSEEQQRLWLVEQVTPQTTAYHVPGALRVRGPLDVTALRDALRDLVARHEALRTSIRVIGDTPCQHVLDTADVDFAVVPAAGGDVDLADLVGSAAYQPFDLAAGPLLRTRVFQVGPADHVLLICAHHCVVDAWSLRLMLAELGLLYRARRRGEPATLPDIEVQYGDYAVWQRDEGAADPAAVAYWRRELADAPAHFSLRGGPPPATPAPAVAAGSVYADIEADLTVAVGAVAAKRRTTPMSVLLAAWAAALARHTGQPEVAVLTPVANRQLPETEEMVGFFVNMVVVRLALGDAGTHRELLARVHDRCVAAYAHQDMPFAQLVGELRLERQLGRTPLSDVMFGYQDTLADRDLGAGPGWDGLDLTPVDLPPRHAKCELAVEVRAHGAGLQLQADYRQDLFEAAEIDDLVGDFRQVLREITADVDGPMSLIQMREATPTGAAAPLGSAPTAKPANLVEEQLRDLAAELLGTPAADIGVDDDFFRLGGNSLLAARFVARVRVALDRDLELRTFLEQPTVAGLARHLAGQPTADQPAMPVLPRPESSGPWATPVSFPQQRLWLLEHLAPGSSAYHVPVALRVTGDLDVPALELALSRLAARHEVLRTSFDLDDGLPVQSVHAAAPVRARTVDLTDDLAGQEQRVAELIAAESAQPFDLGRPPLLRLLAIRLSEAAHVLVLTMHHIVCDGWSARILVRDLTALYIVARYGGGAPAALPELPVQYADFAAWQRAALSGGGTEDLVAYWRSALAGAPAVLQLPLDRPRPAVQRYHGADLRFDVPEQLADGVRRLATDHAATPFMVLLAAVGVTLSRYTGQPDVVVGAPVANRGRPEIEELIGFFANTLALRVDTAGELTGAELLARVRHTCLAGYAHQDLPFDQVVEAVAPARDLSTSPLFQVMLAVDDGPLPPIDLPGLRVDLIDADAHVGKFDLTLVFADVVRGGVARYNTDLFDAATIQRLVDHLLRVLAQLVAAPDQPLAALDLLTPDERRQQLDLWNRAPCHYATDVALHELVREQIAATPDAVALSGCLDCHPDQPCNGQAGYVTYAELGARADRLAAALAGQGVRRGDVVALLVDRSADLVVAELAVLMAGAAFLPLDPHHPPLRNTAIVADADCRAVVTTTRYADRITTAAPVLTMDLLPAAAGAPALPKLSEQDLAYVIYTSGSTGQPKGALVDQGGIVNNLRWMQQDWPLGAGDRLLFKTVHTFDVAVKEIFWPLLAGAQVVIAHPGAERDAVEICRHIADHQATVIHLVPSMLEVVLEVSRERELALSSLRIVMSGAESLSPATHDALLASSSALLLHMYGPTETAIAVTGWPCHEPVGAGRLPLGRAMPNVRLYVLDERLRPLPQGSVGELYVGGLAVGRGYLARPAETAAMFLPDPYSPAPGERMYRTGDLVRYRNDGLLEFRGRRDDQVKIRGLRVEPGEVAATVARHPQVRQATVTTWPRTGTARTDRPVSLVAYLVANETADPDLTPAAVRDYLRERLPSYLVPAHVELLPELPTGTNGKVDHQQLPPPRALDPSTTPDQPTTGTPTTDTERRLAEIWCDVLGLTSVGVHDNFFDLGGHSLLATRLSSRVRDTFDAEIPLRSLFEQPTIAELAKLVTAASNAGGTRTPARIPVIDRSAFRLPPDSDPRPR